MRAPELYVQPAYSPEETPESGGESDKNGPEAPGAADMPPEEPEEKTEVDPGELVIIPSLKGREILDEITRRIYDQNPQEQLSAVPDDIVELFFRDAKLTKELLTADEEVKLAQLIETGEMADEELQKTEDDKQAILELKSLQHNKEEARAIFVEANLRLVATRVNVYRKYCFDNPSLALGDLIQMGTVGLIEAVDGFDWRRGYKLSTYAQILIDHEILRGIYNHESTVRIPVNAREGWHKIDKSRRDLENRTGKEPTVREIAEDTGLKEDRVRKLMDYELIIESLDAPISPGPDSPTLMDFLKDTDGDSGAEVLALDDINSAEIGRIIGQTLKEREAHIVLALVGSGREEPCTLEEAGKEVGLTGERVRQLYNRDIPKVRAALERRGFSL